LSVVDSAMTREVLRDISKRPLDISQLNVHVTHGVVHLQGRVERLRGSETNMDLHEEMNIIVRLLKQKPGIRDVCCEVELGESESLAKRLSPTRRFARF
jgi:hypothetical protein